jgi:bacteriorhodopsin
MHPVLDSSGEEIQISRYLEWAGTTTMMLLTISASGNTMNSSLVKSWSDTAKLLMWDELMILCGLLHSVS